MPSFFKLYPISLTFLLALKLGMKQRLEGQTRHERRGDFMDNSIILNLIFFLPALSLIHIAAQKTKRAQKEEGDPKQESGKRERVRGRALL